MDEPTARSGRRDPERRSLGRFAPGAIVNLLTAARMLGINPDDACALAARGEFPCDVIKVADGYRVPFAALLRVLDSGPVREGGQEGRS